MASPIGDIAVRVGADITPLKKGLEDGSKTVGDFAKKAGPELRKATTEVVKLGAAAAAAAAGGLLALTKGAAESAKEISNLARVSNTSAQDFQKFAFAAETVGIEQEKLADILKDVNDRVGDFLTTGAGPMADFFEEIAPKVGVTAEQFKNLSGPDALQLYVSSLEKANLTQAEMTFFLEAMASDLTLLQPLLANNGRLLEESAKQAEEFGLVLSDIDIENLKQTEREFQLIGEQISAAGNIIAAEFSPILNQLIKEFRNSTDGAFNFAEAVEDAVEFSVKAFGFMLDSIRGVQVALKGAELIGVGFGAAVASAVQLAMEGIVFSADSAIKTVNSVIVALNNIPNVDIQGLSLLTDSAFVEETRAGAEFLRDQVGIVRSELHELAMQELPSENVELFFQRAKMASDELGASISNTRSELSELADDPFAGEDPFDIPQWAANNKKELSGAVSDTAKAFNAIASTMSSSNKKAFKAAKAFAIADALISTYQGIAAGVKLGYPAAIPAVAAAAATGFAQVRAIQSQQFGGAASGASASGSNAPTSTQSPSSFGGSGGGGQAQTLVIEGINQNDLFSGAQVENLAQRLLEFSKDGGEVVIQ